VQSTLAGDNEGNDDALPNFNSLQIVMKGILRLDTCAFLSFKHNCDKFSLEFSSFLKSWSAKLLVTYEGGGASC